MGGDCSPVTPFHAAVCTHSPGVSPTGGPCPLSIPLLPSLALLPYGLLGTLEGKEIVYLFFSSCHLEVTLERVCLPSNDKLVQEPDLAFWDSWEGPCGCGALWVIRCPCVLGRPKQDRDVLCPGLWRWYWKDHQAPAPAALQGGRHGRCDRRLSGQSQDLLGGRGQEGEELLLLWAAGLQP